MRRAARTARCCVPRAVNKTVARTAEQDLRRFDNPPDATSEIPGSKQEASGIALESSSQVVTRL